MPQIIAPSADPWTVEPRNTRRHIRRGRFHLQLGWQRDQALGIEPCRVDLYEGLRGGHCRDNDYHVRPNQGSCRRRTMCLVVCTELGQGWRGKTGETLELVRCGTRPIALLIAGLL